MSVSDQVINHVRTLRRGTTDLTQQDLADRVGVTRQTVVAIEKGKYNPSVGLAIRLSQVFDVAVETLFELETE